MAWEHALLGDLEPAALTEAAAAVERAGRLSRGGGPGDDGRSHLLAYAAALERLGRDPAGADPGALRDAVPGLQTLRLPGSGLVVTTGELNVLPDYLARPEDIEEAPASFMLPLLQSVRSLNAAELRVLAGLPAARRLLPGSLAYPRLGGTPMEVAEAMQVSDLGRRCGVPPWKSYSALVGRNAGHFAPFCWYRWQAFHLMARRLIGRARAAGGEPERERLRLRARIYAGFADHFLQDAFAAGHLINKTLVMQWRAEWLHGTPLRYPGEELAATMTQARQPELHGPGHYDRGPLEEHAPATATGVPVPPFDPQAVSEAATQEQRIAASGVRAGEGQSIAAAYAAYQALICSSVVQIAAGSAHAYFNKSGLVAAAGPGGDRVHLQGDWSMLASAAGTQAAADAAARSRQAITELLDAGETGISSGQIFLGFPDHVEVDGALVSLPDWHRGRLRELCQRTIFRKPSSLAVKALLAVASPRLGIFASAPDAPGAADDHAP